ncbi:hypothetical protein [Erysipelothrix anatis]|uniref:hypothetical protein n=1 Tax=Erysipelothrix anatis TaxID=2683713 RepID=UPI00135748B8|nr:hypothetical protein [Erysipelothrix anatis]
MDKRKIEVEMKVKMSGAEYALELANKYKQTLIEATEIAKELASLEFDIEITDEKIDTH